MEEYKKTVELLRLHGQGHLLAFYDQLTDRQKQQLLDGINGLDFSAISHWIENYVRTNGDVGIPDHFEPVLCYPATPVSEKEKEKYRRAVQQGEDLISSGRVAGFVVAGSRPVKNHVLTGLTEHFAGQSHIAKAGTLIYRQRLDRLRK